MVLCREPKLQPDVVKNAHASRLAVKNNSDLDGKTSFARDLVRALRNINITDRVFGRGHYLCRANRIGRPLCVCSVGTPPP